MKTTLIFLTILLFAIGLWVEIGIMTLIVLPVTLIFAAATIAPFLSIPSETTETEVETAVTFAIASAD